MPVERIATLLVVLMGVVASLLAGTLIDIGRSNLSGVSLLRPLVAAASGEGVELPNTNNPQGTRWAAIQLLAEGRYADARIRLETLPESERRPLDWMRLAIATAYTGDLGRALVDVDSAHIATDALVQWGRRSWSALGGVDDPPLANLWFTAASVRSDGSWVTRRDLGTWWLNHDPARALGYLEVVHTEQPGDAFVTYLLALAVAANGALDRAVGLMEGVYSQTPNPRYCSELARLYLERKKLGDRDHAVDLLKDCITRYPDAVYLSEQLQNALHP